MKRCARCGVTTDQLMWQMICVECDKTLEYEHRQFIEMKCKSLETAIRRLTAAVRQAGDISEWPVCGEGDVVGDELAAALVEAEGLIGG